MKLKLLSLGVAAALAAPITAQAMDADNGHNVEIYGRFNVELANISSDFDNNGPDNEPRFLTDRDMGRWGIKASEKLGNGMTAYGRFEWQELTDEDEPVLSELWMERDIHDHSVSLTVISEDLFCSDGSPACDIPQSNRPIPGARH